MPLSQADTVLNAVVQMMIQRNYITSDSKGLSINDMLAQLDKVSLSVSQPTLSRYFTKSSLIQRYGLFKTDSSNGSYGARYYYNSTERVNNTAREHNTTVTEELLTKQMAKEMIAEKSPALEALLQKISERLDKIEAAAASPYANKPYAEYLDMVMADMIIIFDNFKITDWTPFIEFYKKREGVDISDNSMTDVIGSIQAISKGITNVKNNKTD